MDPERDFFLILIGSVVLSLTAIAVAFYIAYSAKRDAAAKERELRLAGEKQEIEVRYMQANRMVVFGALAGGMSYYLNSTLFAISSLMELLKGEIANKEKISSLSTLITGEIRRGLSVTNNLMKLAHPDRLALRPLSVVELVGSVCDEFRSQVPKSIRVDTHFAQDTPTILGDRELFRQLLLNLLANAKDAMPEGGILGIYTAYRTDSSKGDSKEAVPQGTHLSLRISDNGSGMDEDTRRQIFEPFFTTNTDGNRLGLGLSFVYGIVKMHNGQIQVDSREGEGTTVSLFFPALGPEQLAREKERGDPVTRSETEDDLSLEEKMILVQQKIGQA